MPDTRCINNVGSGYLGSFNSSSERGPPSFSTFFYPIHAPLDLGDPTPRLEVQPLLAPRAPLRSGGLGLPLVAASVAFYSLHGLLPFQSIIEPDLVMSAIHVHHLLFLAFLNGLVSSIFVILIPLFVISKKLRWSLCEVPRIFLTSSALVRCGLALADGTSASYFSFAIVVPLVFCLYPLGFPLS